jgi:acyl-coenzyme A thioesterase PaaI-like protein
MKITDIYKYWQKVENKTMGRWFFSRLIAAIIPYTGALKAKVLDWKIGYAKVELKDRQGIRNHLNSIHAVALTNLGEFVSGLALISQFSDNIRGIPVNINIDFSKKARGTLTAECTTKLPDFKGEKEHIVKAEIKDESNDIVATVTVKWQLEAL